MEFSSQEPTQTQGSCTSSGTAAQTYEKHSLCSTSPASVCPLAPNTASSTEESSTTIGASPSTKPRHDLYMEDDSDAGPRAFSTPLCTSHQRVSCHSSLYNRALTHHAHAREEFVEAMRLYQTVIRCPNSPTLVKVLALNNLGQILYIAGISEEQALAHFAQALEICKANSRDVTAVDYATILSNWCRVQWITGDVSSAVYDGLYTVLSLRQQHLPANHRDVAAAHYNIGVTEYAHNDGAKAAHHLMKYLEIVASPPQQDTIEEPLDPIPALVYILLLQHEDKATQEQDPLAQELVRGLRTLQEKRGDASQPRHEIASVLNFIGTLLFHQRDFDHALLFFQEELRLEEAIVMDEGIPDDISVAVTSNNIARILQELGRHPEAQHYYYRALRGDYGSDIHRQYECVDAKKKNEITNVNNSVIPSPHTPLNSGKMITALPSSTVNLYSTVWYNLGLIHDKQGAYRQAIRAFQLSLSLRMVMLGPDHADCACLLYNIGVLQMEQHLLQEATLSLKEALRIRRAAAAAPTTGAAQQQQLHDGHVVKTLQKLASLHKSKGNIAGALEAQREIGTIQMQSQEFQSEVLRCKDTAATLREMAELYHCNGQLVPAVEQATLSVNRLRQLPLLRRPASDNTDDASKTELVACLEELVAGLLLLGSLHHEICQPDMARTIYMEASLMVLQASQCFDYATELDALQEVTRMLAACHCAPEA